LKNKEMVDKRLSILHKYTAVPLLSMAKEAKTARIHFERCAYYGYPERLLHFVTYLPYIIRRIFVKVLTLLNLI